MILEVLHYTVDVVREDLVDKREFHPVTFRKVIDHVPCVFSFIELVLGGFIDLFVSFQCPIEKLWKKMFLNFFLSFFPLWPFGLSSH